MENMNNQYSNNTRAAWYIIVFMMSMLILISLLTGCAGSYYIMDPVYEDHPHTTEVYWYTDYELGGTPYFGYWDNFYYYYGVPHFYPWWYYYQFIPPYHYYTHSHIIITIDSGYYVYGHRGPKFHNTGPDCKINHGKFTPTIKAKNNKDKSFVFPIDWKSHNSTRTNKHNKYNSRPFNTDINKINNSNVNKNINNSNNIRNSNKNRSNSKPRINKSNKRP